MGGQVPRRCRVRLLSPWASPSQLLAAATNASDHLQIIMLPAQLIPAAASTWDPSSIEASSGKHCPITSHYRLFNDCHTDDHPTDDQLAVDHPTNDRLTNDRLADRRRSYHQADDCFHRADDDSQQANDSSH